MTFRLLTTSNALNYVKCDQFKNCLLQDGYCMQCAVCIRGHMSYVIEYWMHRALWHSDDFKISNQETEGKEMKKFISIEKAGRRREKRKKHIQHWENSINARENVIEVHCAVCSIAVWCLFSLFLMQFLSLFEWFDCYKSFGSTQIHSFSVSLFHLHTRKLSLYPLCALVRPPHIAIPFHNFSVFRTFKRKSWHCSGAAA